MRGCLKFVNIIVLVSNVILNKLQCLVIDFLGQYHSDSSKTCDVLQSDVILLLRRQAASDGNHIASSYSTWFEVINHSHCLT